MVVALLILGACLAVAIYALLHQLGEQKAMRERLERFNGELERAADRLRRALGAMSAERNALEQAAREGEVATDLLVRVMAGVEPWGGQDSPRLGCLYCGQSQAAGHAADCAFMQSRLFVLEHRGVQATGQARRQRAHASLP